MKLSKAQRVTLQIARDLGGSIKVYPDQLRVVSSLAALGLLEINDKYFHRRASLTPAGRATLEQEGSRKRCYRPG